MLCSHKYSIAGAALGAQKSWRIEEEVESKNPDLFQSWNGIFAIFLGMKVDGKYNKATKEIRKKCSKRLRWTCRYSVVNFNEN